MRVSTCRRRRYAARRCAGPIFVIPTLITLWGMTKSQAGIIGTAALVTSALGGVIAGLLAETRNKELELHV